MGVVDLIITKKKEHTSHSIQKNREQQIRYLKGLIYATFITNVQYVGQIQSLFVMKFYSITKHRLQSKITEGEIQIL